MVPGMTNISPQEEKQLVELYKLTLSAQQENRVQVEEQLKQAQQRAGFGVAQLKILHEEVAQINGDSGKEAVCQACAIGFKNYIKKGWQLFEGGVPEPDRPIIRNNIVSVLLQATKFHSKKTQSQLTAAIEEMAWCDFPSDWETLIPSLKDSMNSDMNMIPVALETLETIFRRFPGQPLCKELLQDIKYCIVNFFDAHLALFKMLCQKFIVEKSGTEAERKSMCRSLQMCCSIFYCLNYEDLPEEYENTLTVWFEGFHALLAHNEKTLENGLHDDEPGPLQHLKAQICDNLSHYVRKYTIETEKYIKDSVSNVWQVLISLDYTDKNDGLVASGINFLSMAALQNWQSNPFESGEVLKPICEKVILPNIVLRQSDLENFEDNPLDYIQKDIEGADQDTRRKASMDLVKALGKKQEVLVRQILIAHVQELRQKLQNQSLEAMQTRESCIYIVIAMSVKASSQIAGCILVNDKSLVIEYLKQEIIPILRDHTTNLQNDPFPPLKAACLKYITVFRNIEGVLTDDDIYNFLLPTVITYMGHKSAVVQTYAAHAIDKFLSLRDPKNRSQPRLSPQRLQEPLLSIVIPILTSLQNEEGLKQNEYMMQCIVKIFEFLRGNYSNEKIMLESIDRILSLIQMAVRNPLSPNFTHNLFEALSMILKVAVANPQTAMAVEDKLLPVCTQVLQQGIADLQPYIFQVLGLMLDLSTSIKDIYHQLFTMIIAPVLWKQPGNVPGLVRFLRAYFNKHQQFAAVLQKNMSKVFQLLLQIYYDRKTEAIAFELLNALLYQVPPNGYYDTLLVDLLKNVIAKLQKEKDKNVSLKRQWMVSMSLFVHKHGYDTLFKVYETLQPGLLVNMIEKVWLPAIDTVRGMGERKLCLLALVKILKASNDSNLGMQIVAKIQFLLGLGEKTKDQKRWAFEDEETDVTDVEYHAGFSKLVHCETASSVSDFSGAKNVDEVRKEVYNELQPLKQQLGSAGPSVSALTQWLCNPK